MEKREIEGIVGWALIGVVFITLFRLAIIALCAWGLHASLGPRRADIIISILISIIGLPLGLFLVRKSRIPL